MKKTSILAAAVFLITTCSTANAESIWSADSLGLIEHVSVNTYDNVTGGCWTNMESIKQSARLKLEQSDVNVYPALLSSSNPFAYNIGIYGDGMRRDSGTCVGSLKLLITTLGTISLDSNLNIGGATVIFERGSVAYGSMLNKMFSEAIDQYITELSAEIISQRRNTTISAAISRHKIDYNGTPETMEEARRRSLSQ